MNLHQRLSCPWLFCASLIFLAIETGFAQLGSIAISSQPLPQLVQEGGSADFSVTAESDIPLFYQWLRNGTNIPNATRSSLSLSKVTRADADSYSVLVSNSSRTNQSQAAVLNVYPSGTVPFQGVVYGQGTVTFDPDGIDCGPNCRAYSSGTKATLSISANSGWHIDDLTFPGCSSTDCRSQRTVFVNAKSTSATGMPLTNWTVQSTLMTSQSVEIKIVPPPPVITSQPEDVSPKLSEAISLSVAVTGTGELTYQWFINGILQTLQNGPTLRIDYSEYFYAGKYYVVVSASGSSVTSRVATVRVRPRNDDFGTAIEIAGYGRSEMGANSQGATSEAHEPDHGGLGGASVWWKWTAPTSGKVLVDTILSEFDTLLAVYTGDSVTNLTLVAKDDQSGGNNTSKLIFDAKAGVTYHIAVDGYKGATGDILFDLVMEELHFSFASPLETGLGIYFSGKANSTFSLETSTDLVNWSPRDPMVIGPRGFGGFFTRWSNDSKRFFRLRPN